MDENAAAVLAAALVTGDRMPRPGHVTEAAFAASVYFDCLEALRAERARRHQVRWERPLARSV
jgi:hypothetical protein